MNLNTLGSTHHQVSPIGIGVAALGRPGYINIGHVDDLKKNYDIAVMEARAHAVLDAAYERGVRYFDAARSYGRAEEFLGNWLRKKGILHDNYTDFICLFPIIDSYLRKLERSIQVRTMIRRCTELDFKSIFEIINDAAIAYKGLIPDDRWHEPYMSAAEIRHEIEDGVTFWCFEKDDRLIGVMGIQDRGDVVLIRHAYVLTCYRQQGIGQSLLLYLESLTEKPILVGTWKAASWAISFYEKNGYILVSDKEKDRLLRKYWSIPERQIETSVVLANKTWVNGR